MRKEPIECSTCRHGGRRDGLCKEIGSYRTLSRQPCKQFRPMPEKKRVPLPSQIDMFTGEVVK